MSTELETFIKVIDSGSFSAAAREIGVLPSTVSRQITRLEERLGVRLVHRSTRSVSVTQVGSIFYEGGRRIVEATKQLEATVRDTGSELRGTIRLAASAMREEAFLAELISDFLEVNPQTRVTVLGTADAADYIDNRIDVALRIGDLEDHDWTARRIGSSAHYLAASPDYLSEFGWPRSVEELEDHYCVVYAREPSWPLVDGSTIEPDPRVVVHDPRMLVELVLSGAGIGLVQMANVHQEFVEGQLCRIVPDEVEEICPIWVLYPRHRLFPPTARAFVDHCVEFFEMKAHEHGLGSVEAPRTDDPRAWKHDVT